MKLNKNIFVFFALFLTLAFVIILLGSLKRSYEIGKGNLYEIELVGHGEVTQKAIESVLHAAKVYTFFIGIVLSSIYGLLLLLLSYIFKIPNITSRKRTLIAISLIVVGTTSNVVAQLFFGKPMEEAVYGSVGISAIVSILFSILFLLTWGIKKIIPKRALDTNPSDPKQHKELSETEKRVLVFCTAIYFLLMMSIQKPWEDNSGGFGRIYGWDDFILWAIIPITTFWGILWIRKWKKLW